MKSLSISSSCILGSVVLAMAAGCGPATPVPTNSLPARQQKPQAEACPKPAARRDGKRYPQLVQLARVYRLESRKYEDAKSLFDEQARSGMDPDDLKAIHPLVIETAKADMETYRQYLRQLRRAKARCYNGTGDDELQCAVPDRPDMHGFEHFYSILTQIIRAHTPQTPECVEVQ